jgi:hypothetical protein
MHPTQNPVSAAPYRPSVADTLRRAALNLIRHGWTQDNTYANEMTPAILRDHTFPAADVLGALVLAATGRTLIPGEVAHECPQEEAREFDNAVVYLADWLGLADDPDYTPDFGLSLDRHPAAAALTMLWRWNDAPWQDKSHVIDGLLAAAADYDHTIYKPGTHRPYAADFAALDIKAGTR